MSLFVQQVINGLSAGAIYASLALALVLIFRTQGLVNVAQGEMATFSAYVAWQFAAFGWSMYAVFPAVIAVSFVLGMALERLVIRPVQTRPPLDILVVTLGLLLIFNNLAAAIWGTEVKSLPSIFPSGQFQLGGVVVAWDILGILLLLLVVCGALALLYRATSFGLMMRATTANRESALLCSIHTNRVLMLSWGLAASVGGLAGLLVAPKLFLDPNLMIGVLVYGFAAAALGGFDSPIGVVVGGLVVGVVESLAGTYVSFVGTDLKILVPLVVISAVLLIRPQGLFGTTKVVRL